MASRTTSAPGGTRSIRAPMVHSRRRPRSLGTVEHADEFVEGEDADLVTGLDESEARSLSDRRHGGWDAVSPEFLEERSAVVVLVACDEMYPDSFHQRTTRKPPGRIPELPGAWIDIWP